MIVPIPINRMTVAAIRAHIKDFDLKGYFFFICECKLYHDF